MKKHPNCPTNKQRGVTLVMAIFIVVVLGLLGSYMVRLSGVQYATTSYTLQRARAYQAGRAGLGWATRTINDQSNGNGCTPITTQPVITLPDMPGYKVTLTCQAQGYAEGNYSYFFYTISALSEFGDYDSPDYVSRRLEKAVLTNNI